jgi:hypothetical protein
VKSFKVGLGVLTLTVTQWNVTMVMTFVVIVTKTSSDL